MTAKVLDFETALRKARSFCAYQERCEHELFLKCKEWGLNKSDAEKLITTLNEDKFLNEERFAIAYARGKFRIKKWGKVRIRQELLFRKIGNDAIRKGLQSIDEENNYADVLLNVLQNKISDYEGDVQKIQKLAHYAIGRGFEPELVWQKIKTLTGKTNEF